MTISTKPGHAALRRGRFSLAGQVYHVTTTTRNRSPVFLDFAAACAASRCFHDRATSADARLLAWTLMPDHAHWLVELGTGTLAAWVNRTKSASARAANHALGERGAVWARAYQDHAIRRDEDLVTVARYIVANPVRAGIVTRVNDYPFWNAVWI